MSCPDPERVLEPVAELVRRGVDIRDVPEPDVAALAVGVAEGAGLRDAALQDQAAPVEVVEHRAELLDHPVLPELGQDVGLWAPGRVPPAEGVPGRRWRGRGEVLDRCASSFFLGGCPGGNYSGL